MRTNFIITLGFLSLGFVTAASYEWGYRDATRDSSLILDAMMIVAESEKDRAVDDALRIEKEQQLRERIKASISKESRERDRKRSEVQMQGDVLLLGTAAEVRAHYESGTIPQWAQELHEERLRKAEKRIESRLAWINGSAQ